MTKGIPRPDEIIEKANIAYLIVIISILLVTVYFVETIGKVLIGLVILTIPGYCLMYAILVDVETDMDGVEVIALSIVMSIVVLAFISLILAFTQNLKKNILRLTVLFATAIFLLVGYLREQRLVKKTV